MRVPHFKSHTHFPKMRQKRCETLMKKVDVNTDLLISRFQNIIQLSTSLTPKEIQASEMLQIESNSAMIVRLVEELLSVSRTLKENWLLNQMPWKKSSNEAQGIQEGESVLKTEEQPDFGILKDVMDVILQSRKFEEELSEGEDDPIVEEEKEKEAEVKEEIKEETMDVDVQPTEPNNEEVKAEEKLETNGSNSSTQQPQTQDQPDLSTFQFNGEENTGNNTLDNINSITDNLNDYNLSNYGNENLDDLDFDNFGDDDVGDGNGGGIIMLE